MAEQELIPLILDELAALGAKVATVQETQPPVWPTSDRRISSAGKINVGNEIVRAKLITEAIERLGKIKAEDPQGFLSASDAVRISIGCGARKVSMWARSFHLMAEVTPVLAAGIVIYMTANAKKGDEVTAVAAAAILLFFTVAQVWWKAMGHQVETSNPMRELCLSVLDSKRLA